jgi:hypothetical protein
MVTTAAIWVNSEMVTILTVVRLSVSIISVETLLFSGGSMRTPTHTFRLEKSVIKMMDRLITNPPAVAIDADLGKPRNRTELVEVLIKKAFDELKKTKDAEGEQA